VIHLVFWQQVIAFILLSPVIIIIVSWILERIWLTLVPMFATIIAFVRMQKQGDISGIYQMGKSIEESIDYIKEKEEKEEEPDIDDPQMPHMIRNMYNDFEKDQIYKALDWLAHPLNMLVDYIRDVFYDLTHKESEDKDE